MKKCNVLLAVFLLLFPSLAGAASWVRDDSGVPAPPVFFQGSSGAQTIVKQGAQDRLPVQTATEALGGSPTTNSTDPIGWGQNWFASTFTGATSPSTTAVPLIISDNLVYAYAIKDAGGGVMDVWVSTNRGSTFVKRQANIAVTGYPDGAPIVARRLTTGDTLIAWTCAGGGVTPTCYGLIRASATGSYAGVVPTGIPNGLNGNFASVYQQGTTVLGLYGATGVGYYCRSTDSGGTFACVSSGLGANFLNGDTLTSPSPGVWLFVAPAGIYRSTNDGTSFSQVLNQAFNNIAAIQCMSSTVCVATNNSTTIYRSTNAGATWSIAYTHTAGAYGGLLNFGNNVVVAMPTTAGSDVLGSRDGGLSWQVVFNKTGLPTCTAGTAICVGATLNGLAFVNASPSATTDKMTFSPTIGSGQVVITGLLGIPLAIDSAGRLTANQGAAGGATAPWSTYLSDGTVSRIVNPNTLAVSPVQGATLFNSQTTGAANTAVTVTIAAGAGVRAHVYFIRALCAAAGTANLTITDGGVTVFQSTAAEVTTTPFYLPMSSAQAALTGNTNSAVVVTLGTCGVGNTGTLTVWADRF